ncbi:MAG: hypothetical protein LBB36_06665, partial [Fibromonadaceae bacterium]|nr:hypothetical protein [Fibromonadaceae bacterium]
MSVKTPFILSILLILAGGILVNCSSNSPNDGDGDSSSSRGLSSSGEEEQKWCVYRQDEMCLRGSSPCPGDGGILEDECPAGYDGGGQKLDSSDSGEGSSSSDDSGSGDSSDSGEGSSSDNGGSDDSSSSGTSSSSSVALYEYCIFEAQQLCSKGDELVSRCPPGGKLGNTCPYSSSSSTHTEEPSSSSRIIEYSEFTDSRDGQTYKTVIIGSQTWMAQNLNYFPPGTSVKPDGVTNTGVSACYNDSNSYKPPYSNPGACFSSNASLNGNDVHCIATETVKNCEKYGRLYDWSTAMGLEQA